MADEHDLHDGGAQEEECADDCNSECGGVETAGKAKACAVGQVLTLIGADTTSSESPIWASWSVAERGLHNAFAGIGAITGEDGNGDESSGEENVEDESQESEEGHASEAACQDDGANGIEYRGA